MNLSQTKLNCKGPHSFGARGPQHKKV